MLFNSMPYIFIFLPASVLLYFSINKINETAGKYWLVIISLVFYSLGKVTSLPFLLASLFVNYAFSLAIRHEFSDSHLNRLSTKFFLTLGVVFNVGMLAFFKYADFFIANVNQTTSMNLSFLRMAIPLAISFYTFQQITYLVDLYRNEIKDINFLDYCIFVTFFPRLLMGPITRYNEMIPQFQISEQRKINYTNMALGLYLFFLGLCKRVVIADTFGIYAD